MCEIDVSSSDMCLQVTWMRTAVALVVWNLCKNSVLPKVRCSTALSGPFRSGGLPAGGSGSTASLGMRFRTGSNLAALVFSRSCRQLDSFASTPGGGFWILHLASPGHRSDPGGRSARVVVTGSPAFHGGKDKGTSSGVPEQVRVCETPEEIVIEIEIVCTNGHTATSIGQV